MHRRRLATSVAATAALVLAGAAPALADHNPEEFEDDPQLIEASDDFPGGNITCDDLGFDVLLDKVEDPVEGKDTDKVTTTVTDDDEDEPTFLDVDAKEGFKITAVIVKGSDASLVYFHGDFQGLTAPGEKEISHYEVCGKEKKKRTPTPTPTEPTEEPTEPPEEKDETPEPVPTEVPAGHGGSSDMGTAGLIGLLALGSALVAGLAALFGRRFLNES